ncbi:Crp/Fnr family transcriptional regulator [Alicycliphilus sp. T452]
MSTASARHHEILMSNPWFAGLPQPVREAVLARARLRVLAQGQCLFHRGDPLDHLFALLEGCVRISGTSSEGREALLTFYEPGAWFGEVSVLDGGPRTHTAHAHTPVRLLQLSVPDFEALLAAHPALSRKLLQLESSRLRLLTENFEAFATHSLEQRLAMRLLDLSQSFGQPQGGGVGIDLHLSQEVLAQMVGSTRQRVNQLLRQWEQDGWVAHRYGRLVLLRPDLIKALL